jgi:quercetin dioxygenase-like cupin family protein
MHETSDVETMIAGKDVGVTRSAKAAGLAKLTPLHRELVDDMPRSEGQEVRVLDAVLLPGDVTPRHTHRHPVTVFVVEGTFTLRLDGREPLRIGTGEVFVEPAHVPMTGANEEDGPLRTLLFYVCEPDEPFADPVAASD